MDELRISSGAITRRPAVSTKRPAAAQHETHKILQAALNALPAQIAILDETGRILAVNAAWRRVAEAEPKAGPAGTMGVSYLALCEAEAAATGSVGAAIARGIRAVVTKERGDFYLEYPCCDPAKDRWFAARVSRFTELGPVRVVIAFENVTERKLVEEELRLRDRAMAASDEGIVITDPQKPNNPIIYVNTGFERITGYPREAAIGQNCRFLQGNGTNPEAVAEIRASLQEQRECQVELLNYRKDGTPFWNRLSITPVRDEKGKLIHYVGVQSDISARKRAEEGLKQANEKLAQANAEITTASERMRRDLAAAAKVQRALLPSAVPEVPGVRFAWAFKPCDELAGDLLNIVRVDDSHVVLYLLDVSGHGVASALLSVTVSHILSKIPDFSLAGRQGTDGPITVAPAKIAEELTKRFRWDSGAAQYFTLVYGALNVSTGEFRYVAAGHPGPVYVPVAGNPVVLEAPTGLPIGILAGPYSEGSVQLKPGDRLYIYSDGLTEQMNGEGELFGESRLVSRLGDVRSASLEEGLEQVIGSVEAWGCGVCLKDDVSVLAVEIAKA